MSGRHEGRIAVVTGAAAGIGRGYALSLAPQGATVAVLDRADGAPVVAEIEDAGGTAIAVRADLTDPAAVDAAPEEVTQTLGIVSILVNNAGIYPNEPFEGMALDSRRTMFSVDGGLVRS